MGKKRGGGSFDYASQFPQGKSVHAGRDPHGTPCLFPQGNFSRTGAPHLFPQGSASRAGTPPIPPGKFFPRGDALLVPPGARLPPGHSFQYGLPVPVIGSIVPENKTPQNGPETGTQKWKIGTTFPQRGSLPSVRRLALSHWC